MKHGGISGWRWWNKNRRLYISVGTERNWFHLKVGPVDIAVQRSEGEKTSPCESRVHPDFSQGRNIRCELEEGHQWHRNGEKTWTP